MVNDPSFLQKLEAKRAQVAKAKKNAAEAAKRSETLEAELRGWEEAAETMGLSVGSADTGPTPKRGLSSKWKAVIAHMASAYPQHFTLDDITGLATASGINSTRETIRSQMHGYVESKYLERISDGTYRAAPDGARAAEVSLGTNSEIETAGTDEVPAAS